MKKIVECCNDYVDDNGYFHIDCYTDDDPNSEGFTVAVVCGHTWKVHFHDNRYRKDPKVLESIKEVLRKQPDKVYAIDQHTANQVLQILTQKLEEAENFGEEEEAADLQSLIYTIEGREVDNSCW